MKFWQITSPYYESDYTDTHINGNLEHIFSMPGVKCPICGQTWGGSRILPYECPPTLQQNRLLRNSSPISLEQYKALQEKVVVEFEKLGIFISELIPGDTFQPCYLDIPSRPKADFLWASLASLVVSERVKDVLIKNCPRDVSCCEVLLRKVGKHESTLPALIPESGEPADIVNKVELMASPSHSLERYYEVCIKNESNIPPGCENISVCGECGRSEFDDSKREIRMTEDMWQGNQIFFLATTLYILVTDNLKKIIEGLKPTNVTFSEVGNWNKVANL